MRCILFVFSAFYLIVTPAVFAEESSTSDFTPISNEGYKAIIQFYQYDTTIPLNTRVFVESSPAKTREKIVFTGSNDKQVPGYLELPKKGDGPYPCVLLIHGLGESKNNWWEDNNIAHLGDIKKYLLESGYAVVALDALYHGERIAENQYENPGTFLSKYGWFFKHRNMIIHSTIDYRRLLDYLETRTDIDMTKIGAIGYSLGGTMTFLLTAVDSRVKVSVACVVTPWSKTIFELGKILSSPEDLNDFRRSAISPNNFAHAIGSRPFLMIMGREDPFYTEEEGNQLFDLVPGPTKEIIWFDSGHVLPAKYVQKAVGWFQSHLK
ncbi:alpha/beta hydrolase family protein [Thermodesulfobacteriota bacterium]